MTDRAAKWARRVEEWRGSGLTSVKFCEGREFSAGGLRHWAYRLAQEPRSRPRKSKSTVRMARVLRAPRAEVLALAERSASAAVDAGVWTVEPTLAIELGAARVVVRPGVDPATLATVLDVLARAGAR